MRESSQRKTETRQRILDAAGALFRGHGIDAVGVDAVMHAAGLTHGGFYAHFPSKEALAAEASAAALARSAARWERISQDPDHAAALARIIGPYLDFAHVAATENGCLLPALGAEIARRPEARPGITAALHRMVDALARCLPGRKRERALAALSCMVGAVLLARLSEDPDLAAAFLRAAREAIATGAA
ncbi:MAG TPA: TetR family transcriptional regulator [Acetobacteraceae bacterium]|nr:TetR family transcriptional regulator [Acetobacteraceae bacterium]